MMSLASRRELVAATVLRYQKSSRKDKGTILDEFVACTGYDRKYAIVLLRRPLQSVRRPPLPRHRACKYGPNVKHALTELWQLSDCQCGKLLVAALPLLIDRLKVFGELTLCPDVEEKLRLISPATIDRMLSKVRRERDRGISTTKSGSLLKHQIPIRTFSDWDDLRPGFAEIDLVAHCGGDASGDYIYTLTLTDIATGWVVLVAIPNRSELAVTAALDKIRKILPFALLGIDCDNGTEFINHNLNKYCQRHKITFTRSRPYRKNDQCYVEQKNGHVVRRLAGYARYQGDEAVNILNRIYVNQHMFLNFFQPCRKLTSKLREGAKVKKEYDDPQTPYARLLTFPTLSREKQAELKIYFEGINPALVRRRMADLGHELAKQAAHA
jgi:hypothetical protein